MSAPSAKSHIEEMNRLHEQAQQFIPESREALDATLRAAWQAGTLLREAKKRVRLSAWSFWLEQNFHGPLITAHRYMRLAKEFSEADLLKKLSLRSAYGRLGIPTEFKSPGRVRKLPALPEYVSQANRLLRALPRPHYYRRFAPDRLKNYQDDLRPIYQNLRQLFDVDGRSIATISHLSPSMGYHQKSRS